MPSLGHNRLTASIGRVVYWDVDKFIADLRIVNIKLQFASNVQRAMFKAFF